MTKLMRYLSEARKLLEENKYSEARDNYFKALQTTGDQNDKAIIWAELSWTYYQMQEFERTLEAIENVWHFDRNYKAQEDLYRLKAFAYIGLGKDDSAQEDLLKSLEIDRNSNKQQIAIYELAKIYFKKQEYETAFKLFDEIESYFFQNQQDYWLSILFYKGFIHYYNSNWAESEAIFEELLENSTDGPRKATALFGLAFVAFGKKDYLKTINLGEGLVKNDPNFFDMETVGFLTATSFYYLGRHDVFEQYYIQLQKKYPNGRYSLELTQLKKNIQSNKKK